jgi:hypothetical protein
LSIPVGRRVRGSVRNDPQTRTGGLGFDVNRDSGRHPGHKGRLSHLASRPPVVSVVISC